MSRIPMTRRALIERLAMVGGVSLMMTGMQALGYGIASAAEGPPALPGSGAGKSVVILGAGVAGLAAAMELSKAGYDVKVLEARSFAGGRAQTARKGFTLTELGGDPQACDFDDGHYINHGPWRIPYHHYSTLHYAKSLKVPMELFNNDNDASYLYFEKGTGPLAGKPIRKGQVAADARGYAAEILAKVATRGGMDDLVTAADKEKLIAYMIAEGFLSPTDLAYHGADGRGFEVDPGAGVDPGPGKPSKPFAFTDVLNSGLWRVLSSVAHWDQQRTMFQPVGGMDQIALAMAKTLDGKISFSTVVEKVRQGAKGVEVSVTTNGQRSTVKADYCICTIPLSVLRSVDLQVTPAFKAAINAPAYAPVGKIGLQMKSRFWEEKHAIYGGHVYTDDSTINSIAFPSSDWFAQKGVLLGYYNFGADAAKISGLTPDERAAHAVAFGQKVMPEYAANYEKSFSVAWHRVQYNLGGWVEWSEDARKEAYPILCEPDGRIYLAGEHMSYINGWQAGAIESAWQQVEKLHRRVQAAA
ncbi:flavin monoamine oxidase family protein [Phenylobacterium immobile]|uniref:flavin monoamine oxidase family protein n=1 Tax=Phenylobacterium immobile TaxID=21 RepID=UPI000A6A2958|nr:flavin monoamine oxidase family protein [Phenylobacterium immobile]